MAKSDREKGTQILRELDDQLLRDLRSLERRKLRIEESLRRKVGDRVWVEWKLRRRA